MSTIHSTDPDFRVFQISFETLLEIQADAEARRLATRWTSTEALRGQVKERSVILQSLMREERDGVVRAYRCLVLFSTTNSAWAGGVATIDVEPARYAALDRLDRDSDVRQAFVTMFSLATGDITMVSKN